MSRRATLCLALVALLAAFAAPARAAESHPLLGELIVGKGQNITPDGHLEDACGVALDSHGATYVSDYYHDAIDVFSTPIGNYLTQIAGVSAGNGPCGLAVDAAGNVYAVDWRADVVRFAPSSYPVSAETTYGPPTTIEESGKATGVAVDSSTGNLYVDDSTYIAEYSSAGSLLRKIGEGQLTEAYGLALSAYAGTKGDLYVADAASRAVKAFGPAGESLPSIAGAGSPQGGFRYLVDSALAVDPTDGHLFVADAVGHGLSEHPEMALDEFNPAGEFRAQIAEWITHPADEPGVIVEHHLFDPEPPGLVIGPSGNVYVTSENSDSSESGALDENGKPLEGSVLYSFGPTAPAKPLEVTKSGTGGGTVTSSPAGIACGPACAAEYDEGTKVTLTAAHDSHSEFKGWSGACTGTATTCQLTMSTARSVGAEFEALPQRKLTVGVAGGGEGAVTSSPAGIECRSGGLGSCEEEFNQGSTVILTETPAPHSRFTGWGGPDCDESTQPSCEVLMSEAKALSAGFAPIPQQTLEVSVQGEGTVTSEPAGIGCPGICREHFDSEGPASHIVLLAHPASHQQVAWTGCEAQPSPEECEVSMSEARAVSAAFAPIERTLTVLLAGSGEVSADRGSLTACGAPGGSCSATYADGEDATLTATPAPGWSFAGWSGGACGGTRPCLVSLSADTTVTANFAQIPVLPEEPPPTRLSLGKLAVKGASALLRASVSGPGALSAAGKGLKRLGVRASAAGPLSLHLRLSAAGGRSLSRHGVLRTKVTVTFSPANGAAPASAIRNLIFKTKGKAN